VGLRGTRYPGNGENYIMSRVMICTPHPILFGDQIEKNEMSGERRGVYRVLMGKLEGKRPLGRPRHR